jgi:hypothetical protein
MLAKAEESTEKTRSAEPGAPAGQSNSASSVGMCCLTACVIAPVVAITAALLHLRLGWDDGAITAAFSRTFHETGRFALTPYSVIVEGFSSMLWTLVLAGLDNFGHTVDAMLAWSKIASFVAFALSLLVFARLARRFLTGALRYLAIVLLALMITPFREVINGMEMNLYMLLILTLTEVLLSETLRPALKWPSAAVLSCAVLLTRFETPFLFLFLFAGIFLATRRKLGVVLLAAFDALFFGLTEIWRHRAFGQWVPNTIIAKRWVPYSPRGLKEQVVSRAGALSELVIVLALPLAVLLVLWIATRVAAKRQTVRGETAALSPILLSMTLGAVLLGLAMGKNWGHPGRMYLGFLPFMILALVALFGRLLPRTTFALQPFVLTVILLQAFVWTAETKITGFWTVTYASIEKTGLAADELRRILHKDTLSAFIPDVGGSSLCCEKLNIMDSALLANPVLAREGYAGTAAFLAANRPDMIEIHSPWGELDGLYAPHGLDGYGEVMVMGKAIFVREDLYAELKRMGYVETLASEGVVPCSSKAEAMARKPEDRAFALGQQRCIFISR